MSLHDYTNEELRVLIANLEDHPGVDLSLTSRICEDILYERTLSSHIKDAMDWLDRGAIVPDSDEAAVKLYFLDTPKYIRDDWQKFVQAWRVATDISSDTVDIHLRRYVDGQGLLLRGVAVSRLYERINGGPPVSHYLNDDAIQMLMDLQANFRKEHGDRLKSEYAKALAKERGKKHPRDRGQPPLISNPSKYSMER